MLENNDELYNNIDIYLIKNNINDSNTNIISTNKIEPRTESDNINMLQNRYQKPIKSAANKKK